MIDYTNLRARFTPQVWINDYAHEIDSAGEREWDLDPELVEKIVAHHAPTHPLGIEGAFDEALEADTYVSDEFKHDPAAPEWVREHDGPFYCEVYRVDG